MKIEPKIFSEPLLEFGSRHFHSDPRLGLMDAGPLQTHVGETIHVAVVGSQRTQELTESFFNDAVDGIETSSTKHPNMNPDFPGLANRNPFRCKFSIMSNAAPSIPNSQIDTIVNESNDSIAVDLAVDTIMKQLESIEESTFKPDIAIIALPIALIDRVWGARSPEKGSTERDDSAGSSAPDFRGQLKARAMSLPFAVQIVWEDVLDDKVKIPRKLKESSNRKIQSKASRTWNLFTTLYYKGSGKVPWRRMPKEGEFKSCYVGISFFRTIDGQQLWSSTAQMFDERGRGFILKGAKAHTESRGRHPYLTEEDAEELIDSVFDAYKKHHGHFPARVIVLKTSRFRDEEAKGIFQSLANHSVERRDLVWIQESTSLQILRNGDYPVLRGTFVELDGKGLLYTNGSIPYYGTYPGLYVPKPLMLCPHAGSDSTVSQIAEEVFSLTKINWNSTNLNQKLPIPIRAARKVGEVLKYLPEGLPVSSDYRKYI